MATYYVDPVNGLDTNNGLGPDASAATNKPWKTMNKLLAGSVLVSGDTAYLAPGTFREVSVSIATSGALTSETKIIGDPLNAQGFKTSAGVLVAPGPVIWTNYLTNDKTAPSVFQMLSNPSSRHFMTWQNITWIGSGQAQLIGGGTSHDWKIIDCGFITPHNSSFSAFGCTVAFGVASNILFDRCVFFKSPGSTIAISMPTGVGADYDANITIRNCTFTGLGGSACVITASGASANKGGGVRMYNCFNVGGVMMQTTGAGGTSTSIPCGVWNSVIIGGTNCLTAQASGQIIEDYNIINSTAPRSNVTAGTHSISDFSYNAGMFHFGQERIWGQATRFYGEPMAGSPLLGFGNDGTQTAYDLRNRPRPAGGASALPGVGPYERGNTFAKETGTVRTGANAISITGPGYQEFLIPVTTTSTTISVYMRWDATYAGTKPQFQIDAQPDIGVAAETKTAVGSSGAWEQLTLSAITPTANGIVTVRVISNDTNGGGKAFVDDFAVS